MRGILEWLNLDSVPGVGVALRVFSILLALAGTWALFTWACDGPAAFLLTQLGRYDLLPFREEEVRYEYEIVFPSRARVLAASLAFALLRSVLLPTRAGEERAAYDAPRIA